MKTSIEGSQLFELGFSQGAMCDDGLWFVLQKNSVLIDLSCDKNHLPSLEVIQTIQPHFSKVYFLGSFNEIDTYAATLSEEVVVNLPQHIVFRNVRQVPFACCNDALFLALSRAMSLQYWDQQTQYCGSCSGRMVGADNEHAKICNSCSSRQYPLISPAVVALVWHDDQVLLARFPEFKEGVHGLIAGFVEPGETLEQAVTREIKEEVGISVKNLEYFGSQPWPFPSSIMVGFYAEYDSLVICENKTELLSAAWHDIDSLPRLPSPMSISRIMVDEFVACRRS